MISIVIPVYNQAEFLPQAIESVLPQLGDNELIVVNDGSTDNSLKVAEKYVKEIPNAFVVNQVNKGLSAARNAGLMNMSPNSAWLWPLDADDKLEEVAIQKMAALIDAYSKADDLAEVFAPSFKCFGLRDDEIILMPEPKLEDFKSGNRVGYCSVIKKTVLQAIGGYSPRMLYGYEDLHLWLNILSRGGRIVTTPEILWGYRVKEHSMLRDAIGHHQELLAQIKKDFNIQLNF